MRKHTPIHPGETLNEDFLKPLKMSARALAAHIDVPANRITRIVKGETAITADTAVRLEQAFGVSAKVWLGLQAQYELIKTLAATKGRKKIKPLLAA
ncbi:MAG: HigA family addiction module antidote protein [Rhodospirillales bacterium]|jgi:antitoxin HigA-1|nr:HigA family addiction module antidote protein [Rhodospirillales bacterium]